VPPTPTITLYAKRIVDGSGAPPFEGEITLADGRIQSVAKRPSERAGSASDALALEDYTLLPGLIDAHSHVGILTFEPANTWSVAEMAALIFRNCSLALDAGFTTLRDLAGVDGGLCRAIAAGMVRGPRILPSGPIICQTGGHGDRTLPFEHRSVVPPIRGLVQAHATCDSADSVRLAARRALVDGATQIKIAINGGAASYGDSVEFLQYSIPELEAAVAEASAHRTYVTAHAHHHASIMHGLSAGIRCFEHGTFLDDATAQAMADANASLVPTLTVFKLMEDRSPDLAMPEEFCERAAGFRHAMQESIRVAVSRQVRVGLGTDLVGPLQLHRGGEVALRAHVTSPSEAIHSATGVNAAILGIGHITGMLKESLAADVIAVSGDPFEEPDLFQDASRVSLVLQGGAVRSINLPDGLREALMRMAPLDHNNKAYA
jgi:imidazolonepropionase-like amidohydrolase